MPQYQRTKFDEEEMMGSSSDSGVIFPPDITKGFSNPNVSENSSTASFTALAVAQSGDIPFMELHPMVHLQRSDHHQNTIIGSSSSGPSVKFFKSNFMHSFPSRASPSVLWSRTTVLEKSLVFICILLSVLLFMSIFSMHRVQDSDPSSSSHLLDHQNGISTRQEYCLSAECVTVASAIINAMDTSVDPCDDFYTYACGGWIKANPLPDGKSIWGSFNKLWQENQLVMKNVLDNETDFPLNTSRHVAERSARTYYKSCLDKNETTEKRGAEPLLDFIKTIGGWNVTGAASGYDPESWNFQSTIQLLHNKYNRGGGLFSWAVGADEKNSSVNVLQLDQSGLILPSREHYLNRTSHEKVLSAYLSYMVKVAVLLGAPENETRQQMEHVIDFETRVANITIPAEERRDDERMYNKISLQDLQHRAPFLNWTQYFESAFHQINASIDANESIVLYSPDYLSNLSNLMMEYNSSRDGRVVLGNYLVWSAAQTLTPTLSKPIRDASKILRKALIGSEGSETPWRYCVSDTNNVMGFALGAMFVRSVFRGRSKELAQVMIQEVKDAFKENLPHLKWMDAETRILAKEKADAITDMIGFPDFILDPDRLDQRYEGLDFKEDEYFENNIRVNMFSLRKNLERKISSPNKTEWEMTPPAVNAYYAPTKNQIVFPAGILQAPFYDINYPKSLNFGAMGVVMGHELTHAFDDQGREYDKEGNLHQWWRNKTLWHFVQRIQCFIDQYGNFSIENSSDDDPVVHVNGKQTLGENIADNGGLKAAFHAYEEWIKTHTPELPLPGVNLTSKQLFFMGFAQVWCSVNTEEALKLQILQDPHSPSIYRVLGTLSNSDDFAREFHCPKGSRMNPENKCDVW